MDDFVGVIGGVVWVFGVLIAALLADDVRGKFNRRRFFTQSAILTVVVPVLALVTVALAPASWG